MVKGTFGKFLDKYSCFQEEGYEIIKVFEDLDRFLTFFF